jgi:hypothetical protein
MKNSFIKIVALFIASTLGVHAETCPLAVSKGIDHSGTDYYNAKKAACLPNERALLKKSILSSTSNNPHAAWKITDALLCGKNEISEKLINSRIINPIKEVISFANSDEKELTTWNRRKATDLMEKGCAFEPEVRRMSNSILRLSYTPYSTQLYCGSSFIINYRKGNWFIVEKNGGCS